jgi:hypothetical protein
MLLFKFNQDGQEEETGSNDQMEKKNTVAYHKLDCISEIKIMCLHFGAIVADILQETYDTHTRYI